MGLSSSFGPPSLRSTSGLTRLSDSSHRPFRVLLHRAPEFTGARRELRSSMTGIGEAPRTPFNLWIGQTSRFLSSASLCLSPSCARIYKRAPVTPFFDDGDQRGACGHGHLRQCLLLIELASRWDPTPQISFFFDWFDRKHASTRPRAQVARPCFVSNDYEDRCYDK